LRMAKRYARLISQASCIEAQGRSSGESNEEVCGQI
jgi:hypothetical protein